MGAEYHSASSSQFVTFAGFHTMNLRHMSFKEALLRAKDASGLSSNDAIANRSGLGVSAVTRYFQMGDDYCPAADKLPALCRALGNTLLLDWIAAQIEDMTANDAPIHTPEQVAHAALEANMRNGELSAEAAHVIADHIVTPEEARVMQGKHLEHAEFHKRKAAAYERLAGTSRDEFESGHIMGATGWKRVEIPAQGGKQ